MTPKLIGLLMIGVPALALGALVLWRRHRPVFFFFVALLAVGLGYLSVTGAAEDVYYIVFGSPPAAVQVAPAQ